MPTKAQKTATIMRNSLIILLTLFLLSSCGDKVYDKYKHTSVAGWEKNDTLSFDVSPLAQSGQYDMGLGLRITNSFPFMSITLIVEQTVYPKGTITADTINCQLIDRRGVHKEQGVSYYQYNFPIETMNWEKGDSIHINVRHDMKREILPGVSEVGIIINPAKP